MERVIHLIRDKKVSPEQILVATFTKKAEKELVTRITNRLADTEIDVNVNDMYVGNFHSICHRIVKDYPEYSRISKNYDILEEFEQQYMVYRNMKDFADIDNIGLFSRSIKQYDGWYPAGDLVKLVNDLRGEMIDIDRLGDRGDARLTVARDIMRAYEKLLERENVVDFSGLQTECMRLFLENPEILEEMQNKIRYIMVDEYQDTNYIQEQFVFLLGKYHKNICVVGDDDQSLYRFKGATVRNILEFSGRGDFVRDECRVFKLEENYRSNKSIIQFYNHWMQNPVGFTWSDGRNKYRLEKEIFASEKNKTTNSPAAIKLSGSNERDWLERIGGFVKGLIRSKKITNYNQIAFLFFSLKRPYVQNLANYLESEGISVYAPRSNMYFQRREILPALGLLILMFPQYAEAVEREEEDQAALIFSKKHPPFINALRAAQELLRQPEHSELKAFIEEYAEKHRNLTHTTDYRYSSLLYKLFGFEPFRSILSTDMKSANAVTLRAVRNLSILTRLIIKFEDISGVSVLNGDRKDDNERWIDYYTRRLFNVYLYHQKTAGINEYEDDSEYAPSGCVSFLTIHQSKGMEFPIVFVGSMDSSPFVPKENSARTMMEYIEKNGFFHRAPFEPSGETHNYDFWRLFYTAFSRAQDLLILTGDVGANWPRVPSWAFAPFYNALPNYDDANFDLNDFEFGEVKDVELKDTFSFTSHILVYEKCPGQYKFFKELEFAPVKENNVLFGMLVHQTIEDIHRAAIRKRVDLINPDQIEKWLYFNYHTLAQRDNLFLGDPQIRSALKQVLQYADAQKDNWSTIWQTEVDVSYVTSRYILGGKIDLIKIKGDSAEIVDFKSDSNPHNDKDRMEHYRRQLQLYAHLVKKNNPEIEISGLNLYYTSLKDDPMVSFDYVESDVTETINDIDVTVGKILNKDFNAACGNKETCRNCDFSAYCKTDK